MDVRTSLLFGSNHVITRSRSSSLSNSVTFHPLFLVPPTVFGPLLGHKGEAASLPTLYSMLLSLCVCYSSAFGRARQQTGKQVSYYVPTLVVLTLHLSIQIIPVTCRVVGARFTLFTDAGSIHTMNLKRPHCQVSFTTSRRRLRMRYPASSPSIRATDRHTPPRFTSRPQKRTTAEP